MRQVSENMPKRWLLLPIDPGGVKLISFVMFMESIQPEGVPVPLNAPAAIDMWLAAAQGDYSGMALATMSRNLFLPNLFVYGDMFAKGGSGGDFEGRADDPRGVLDPPGTILGAPMSVYLWGMMRGWPTHVIPEQYLPLQPTDVETLLVSGSVDFSTPPQFATNELLPYLNKGEQVILDDFGHTESFWSSQPAARVYMLNTFFDTGRVDASLYKHQAVDFDAGLGWPGLAKILVAIVLAVLAVLGALAWLIARRILRRRAGQG